MWRGKRVENKTGGRDGEVDLRRGETYLQRHEDETQATPWEDRMANQNMVEVHLDVRLYRNCNLLHCDVQSVLSKPCDTHERIDVLGNT